MAVRSPPLAARLQREMGRATKRLPHRRAQKMPNIFKYLRRRVLRTHSAPNCRHRNTTASGSCPCSWRQGKASRGWVRAARLLLQTARLVRCWPPFRAQPSPWAVDVRARSCAQNANLGDAQRDAGCARRFPSARRIGALRCALFSRMTAWEARGARRPKDKRRCRCSRPLEWLEISARSCARNDDQGWQWPREAPVGGAPARPPTKRASDRPPPSNAEGYSDKCPPKFALKQMGRPLPHACPRAVMTTPTSASKLLWANLCLGDQ